jgi:hypothetical protein
VPGVVTLAVWTARHDGTVLRAGAVVVFDVRSWIWFISFRYAEHACMSRATSLCLTRRGYRTTGRPRARWDFHYHIRPGPGHTLGDVSFIHPLSPIWPAGQLHTSCPPPRGSRRKSKDFFRYTSCPKTKQPCIQRLQCAGNNRWNSLSMCIEWQDAPSSLTCCKTCTSRLAFQS